MFSEAACSAPITEMSFCEYAVSSSVPQPVKDIWSVSRQMCIEAMKAYFESTTILVDAIDIQTLCDGQLPRLRKHHIEAISKLEQIVITQLGTVRVEMNFEKLEVVFRIDNERLECAKEAEPLLEKALFNIRMDNITAPGTWSQQMSPQELIKGLFDVAMSFVIVLVDGGTYFPSHEGELLLAKLLSNE